MWTLKNQLSVVFSADSFAHHRGMGVGEEVPMTPHDVDSTCTTSDMVCWPCYFETLLQSPVYSIPTPAGVGLRLLLLAQPNTLFGCMDRSVGSHIWGAYWDLEKLFDLGMQNTKQWSLIALLFHAQTVQEMTGSLKFATNCFCRLTEGRVIRAQGSEETHASILWAG